MNSDRETGSRILVVEDDDTIRLVISQVLEEDGHDVTSASSGEEALAEFKKSPSDLILTDIIMGEMSGIDLLREVREISAETPVIVVTSQASFETAAAALRLGAYDYLTKPFEDLDVISAAVKRAVEWLEMGKHNRRLLEDLEKNAEELRKAKEAAEKATRTKSQFLANMSHEIRTPMNGVLGMLDLVLNANLPEEQKECLEIARDSAESLLTLINDILDFSKIEARELVIEEVPFDLGASVEGVADVLAPLAEEKGLELLVRYHPGAPRSVVGDPGRIRQVLMNFISNAIKFTHQGHIMVEVACEAGGADDADCSEYVIRVIDTGIGIPEEKTESVFDLFTQADSSTTREYGGTGLGLSISKQLIELMGGSIGVRSAPGEGSDFWFRLRLPLSESVPSSSPTDDSLATARVLVVDDLEVSRQVVLELVDHMSMRHSTATGVDEAVEAFREARSTGDPFSFAIIDNRAPTRIGEAFSRTVSTDSDLSSMPMVFLTTKSERWGADRPKKSGFISWALKPLMLNKLQEAVAAVWPASGHSAEDRNDRDSQATDPILDEFLVNLQVLVAEDNPVNQKVASMLLEKLGCQVDVAATGREAVEMIGSKEYGLVLMDCQMPEMDGYEATREIRRLMDPESRIPIIALTGNAMQGDREKCIDAGMDDHILKPIRSETLEAILEKWID